MQEGKFRIRKNSKGWICPFFYSSYSFLCLLVLLSYFSAPHDLPPRRSNIHRRKNEEKAALKWLFFRQKEKLLKWEIFLRSPFESAHLKSDLTTTTWNVEGGRILTLFFHCFAQLPSCYLTIESAPNWNSRNRYFEWNENSNRLLPCEQKDK